MSGQNQKTSIPALAKAFCRLGDGECRDLFVTELSMTGMFIVSMQPPEVGTVFSVILQPKGMKAFKPMDVRVTRTVIDPSDAASTGFRVNFVNLDRDEVFNRLCESLDRLKLPYMEKKPHREYERRAQPRVWSSYTAKVTISNISMRVRIANLSMSGAFLDFGGVGVPVDPEPEMRIFIDIDDKSAMERIVVMAEVVRLMNVGDIRGLGVRFIEPGRTARCVLEQLMLLQLSFHEIELNIRRQMDECRADAASG